MTSVLSVRGSRELQAVVLAIRGARSDLRNDTNRATRQTFNPVWREELARRARTDQDRQVIVKGARIMPGSPPVAVAATSKRPLRGGLVPADQWHAVEFGAAQTTVATYTRTSRKGKSHQVTRHTTRGLPPRYRKGRVAFPVMHDLGPRVTALWVQLVVRRFAESMEAGE